MTETAQRSLEYYLAREYSLRVIADPDSGYVIDFPDLPGCMSQVESLDEVSSAAEEIRILWLTSTYEQGMSIPEPSYPEEYSGKFNLRVPRSLHRTLVEAAERDGVSLNQYVVMLLSRGVAERSVEGSLDDVLTRQERLNEELTRLQAHVGQLLDQLAKPGDYDAETPRHADAA